AYSVTSNESSIHPTPPASRELRSAALTSRGHSSPRILLVGRSAAICTLFTPLASIVTLFADSPPESLPHPRADSTPPSTLRDSVLRAKKSPPSAFFHP